MCLLGIICLSILTMHFICAFVTGIDDRRRKKLEYVNIAFHVLMLIPMFMLEFDIERAVLFFMGSVFTHSLFGAIAYKIEARAKAKCEASAECDGQEEVSA